MNFPLYSCLKKRKMRPVFQKQAKKKVNQPLRLKDQALIVFFSILLVISHSLSNSRISSKFVNKRINFSRKFITESKKKKGFDIVNKCSKK